MMDLLVHCPPTSDSPETEAGDFDAWDRQQVKRVLYPSFGKDECPWKPLADPDDSYTRCFADQWQGFRQALSWLTPGQ